MFYIFLISGPGGRPILCYEYYIINVDWTKMLSMLLCLCIPTGQTDKGRQLFKVTAVQSNVEKTVNGES